MSVTFYSFYSAFLNNSIKIFFSVFIKLVKVIGQGTTPCDTASPAITNGMSVLGPVLCHGCASRARVGSA